ncbi:MAG TPA: hypothetical protein ENI06_05680 [Spirochaetales bacterium]|nr:hypothetical protein [Spirochaetales bacterium]
MGDEFGFGRGYGEKPYGKFSGQQLFEGGDLEFQGMPDWYKRMQKKQTAWGQGIGIYGAQQ